ncbi:Protein HAF-4, partial [Aphelenchoides avenae]
MRQAQVRSAIATLIYSVFDVLLAVLCLCYHGNNFGWHNVRRQFAEGFHFYSSTVDLFLLTIARVALVSLGCALLLLKADSTSLLKKLSHFSFSVCILSAAYSPTKLLLLADQGYRKEPVVYAGDWAILFENFLFSIVAHRIWLKFVRASEDATTNDDGYETLVNGNDEEEEEVSDITTSTEDSKVDKSKNTFQIVLRLLQYCRAEWIWHVSGFTFLFIYSLTRIFVPYYTGQVVASVVSAATDPYIALVSSVKLMLLISIVSAASGGLRGGSFEYAYARINRAIRANLFTSLVKQDMAFYDKHKTGMGPSCFFVIGCMFSGEITSRLTADTQTMSDTVALNVNVFLRNIVQMGGSMMFMMALCWKLSLIPFIVVPIILVASKIFGVYYDFLSEKTQEAVAHSNDVAEEVLSTMRTVRSFACEDVESDRFYEKLTRTLLVTRQKAFAYVGYLWVSELFQTVINVAVLWYGGHLVLQGELKKDLLVSFLLYQMQLADNIRQLGEVWTGLMQSVGASRKVFEYIDRKPDIDTNGTFIPEK